MAALPTGTVTFLFSDIEGSTVRWERTPTAMSAALARHDEIMRQSIESHDGVVFKTIGDAFCAAFASPLEALRAAAKAQRNLNTSDWSGVEPIHVRMALHTGAAEIRDSDYFGPPLNRVSRLLNTGHGGQVLLSQITAELVRDALPEGLFLLDLGEHVLRDIDRPERVAQLAGEGLVESFPPLRASVTRMNNLPVARTRFIGRDEELRRLEQLLLRDNVSLLTLTGPGGTGKSRLALEVAGQLAEELEHGVCFIPLAAVSDPAVVPTAMASALGIPESAAARPLDGVIGFVSSRRMMILIDNFEQVLDAASDLVELLSAAPDLKLLVTSRASLRITGEHEFPVAPLSVSGGSVLAVEDGPVSPAIALFLDRATAARPGFVMDESNAADIAEICRRLDGLPLAIELAAARIKLLSPSAMLARLDHRLNLLTGGARDLPERQQTLRSAINWSYELLDESERRLFRRLSVFAGGSTLEAAEHVGMGPNDPEEELTPDILDLVASLLDKSLLRQEEGELEGRFGMLHTIREFGLERLAASSFDADARARHAEYYLQLAETAAPRLFGPLQTDSLREFSVEHDNIRAALDWYDDTGDRERLVRLVLATWWFWYLRGHLKEGRRWVERARETLGEDERSEAGARLALALGSLVSLQAEYDLAERVLDEGRAVALELGKPELAARILSVRAQATGAHANNRDAVAMLHQAEREQRELGDRWGLALTLMFRSMRSWALHQRQAAKEYALESTRIFQELGDAWGAALSPSVLARLAMEAGHYQEARSHLNRALRRWTETGDRWALGHVLNGQGDIARLERSYEEAEARYNESLEIFRGFGNKNGMASALHNLGYVRLYQGDAERAAQLFRESMGLFKALNDRRGVLECVVGLAAVSARNGNGRRAALLFGAAEAELDALGLSREGSNERDYREAVELTRSSMETADFQSEWQRGRRLTYEQALDAALLGNA